LSAASRRSRLVMRPSRFGRWENFTLFGRNLQRGAGPFRRLLYPQALRVGQGRVPEMSFGKRGRASLDILHCVE